MEKIWEKIIDDLGASSLKEYEVRNEILSSSLSEEEIEEFVSYVCNKTSKKPEWLHERDKLAFMGTIDEHNVKLYYKKS